MQSALSDPDNDVIHRSKHLRDNGFGCYNGLLVVDESTMGQSGQAVSIVGGPLAAVLSTPLRLVTTNVYGMAATVEDLAGRHATGMLQVLEPSLPASSPALAH